jgi:hypothetical protein
MNLCIPRVNSNISKDYICDKLCNLQAINIERIIEIPLKNDPTHKRILLKIQWRNNETSKKIQDQFQKSHTINYVHEFPWYWKIVTTNQRI